MSNEILSENALYAHILGGNEIIRQVSTQSFVEIEWDLEAVIYRKKSKFFDMDTTIWYFKSNTQYIFPSLIPKTI